jgi:protocatechuate 3,4-dioxygenase beta subunit
MRAGMRVRPVVLCVLFGFAAFSLVAQADSPSLPPTVPLTEGPFYKAGSPERRDLAAGVTAGTRLAISGTVYDLKGRPCAGAWLDFWQADSAGRYDNRGFSFRGHQFTDGAGHDVLNTVVPGEYPGRTPHIHVKLRAAGGSTLTTQIFFPGNPGNESDPIFARSLVIDDGSTS